MVKTVKSLEISIKILGIRLSGLFKPWILAVRPTSFREMLAVEPCWGFHPIRIRWRLTSLGLSHNIGPLRGSIWIWVSILPIHRRSLNLEIRLWDKQARTNHFLTGTRGNLALTSNIMRQIILKKCKLLTKMKKLRNFLTVWWQSKITGYPPWKRPRERI